MWWEGDYNMQRRKFLILISSVTVVYLTLCIVVCLQSSKIKDLNSEIADLNCKLNKIEYENSDLETKVNEYNRINSEYDFYHSTAVICDDDSNYFHKYDCYRWNHNAFYIYNYENAVNSGYEACPECY